MHIYTLTTHVWIAAYIIYRETLTSLKFGEFSLPTFHEIKV